MIPSISRTEREREREAEGRGEGVKAEAIRLGQKEGSFVIGFAGAIGAYGASPSRKPTSTRRRRTADRKRRWSCSSSSTSPA